MAEYIEREALLQTIQKDPWIGAQGKDYALCDIAEQPTADVVEVRHGEWKLYGNDDDIGCSYFCSLCAWNMDEDEYLDNWSHFKYCPNCGAKMNGKDDNDG